MTNSLALACYSFSMPASVGVVLLNMGGPDSLEAVEPFLRNLFRDPDIIRLPLKGLWLGQELLARRISRRRSQIVRGYYERIGGRSPIGEITRAQAQALEEQLNRTGEQPFRCYVAMRYWHPFTKEALDEIRRDGITRLVALSLYPHYTSATTGSSLHELRRCIAGPPPGLGAIELLEIDRFYDHPRYLDALTATVEAALGRARDPETAPILFSAHGLPKSFLRAGEPYVDHLHGTIAGVMMRLAAKTGRVHPWRLAYQSRVGDGWIGPGTEVAIGELANEGYREAIAVPISFVSDHIETLYEIDQLFAGLARQKDLTLYRAPALNTSPLFIDALAALVRGRVERSA